MIFVIDDNQRVSTLLGMTTRFPLNGFVTSTTGSHPNDKIFWKITEKNGDKIRLCPTKRTFTLKGNLIPGEVDTHAKSIIRKIAKVYDSEILGPVLMGGVVLGLCPWNPTKKLMGRGGKRIGAGRKKGSGHGRNALTKSITLTTDEWARIEYLRGSASNSEFIRNLVFHSEKKFEK